VYNRWSARVFSDDATTTIVLMGEIDLTAAPRLRLMISDALADEPAHLVVDLSATTFMDSTGLQVLVVARQTTRLLNIDLTIVPGPQNVMRVLQIAGLDDQLDLGS
jgi:anti-sigma B factor antagonist